MKKPIFFLTLFLTALLLSSGVSQTSAHGGEGHQVNIATYSVLETNSSAINYWWDSAEMTAYPYTVDENTDLIVEIDDDSNVNSLINIAIGNSTFIDQLDNDAADNLGLGYYALTTKLGFVAPTIWEAIDTGITDLNLTSYSFNNSTEFVFGAATYDAVHITLSDGFQTSELIYDKNTGILYFADITIGNFVLSFEITGYVPVEADDEDENDISFNFLIPLIISFSIITIFRKRSRQ